MLKDYGVSFWGQAAPDTGVTTRIRLGGREYDRETGLYYLRGRYYDPGLGRFLSEDPLGVAGGLNLYAYAGNDPINHRDPYGLCHTDDHPAPIKIDSSGNITGTCPAPSCQVIQGHDPYSGRPICTDSYVDPRSPGSVGEDFARWNGAEDGTVAGCRADLAFAMWCALAINAGKDYLRFFRTGTLPKPEFLEETTTEDFATRVEYEVIEGLKRNRGQRLYPGRIPLDAPLYLMVVVDLEAQVELMNRKLFGPPLGARIY
ncbi:MAG: RHS repeat-associated core domain-containing protein [Gemmatimonadales bacterium]